MNAKETLLKRLEHLEYLVNHPQGILIDNGVAPTQHNDGANMLRKGLGIIVFNILEDFVKNKVAEFLAVLPTTGIAFDKLTVKLQDASIIDALNAIAEKARLEKKDDPDNWRGLIQDEAFKIHSTKNSNYEISKFSLVSTGSNVSEQDVSSLIKALGITGGWQSLKGVADAYGGGGYLDLAQVYKNLSSRRNKAAHDASFMYEYTWLSEAKNQLLILSSSIDILLTATYRLVNVDNSKAMERHDVSSMLNYRFLEESRAGFRETKQINGRARKIWRDVDLALANLRPNLERKKEFLILLDRSGRIKDWHCS